MITKANAAMQFDYRTEPYRAALLIAGVLVVMAVFAPLLLFRLVLLAMGAGPGAWALLQWRRQGRGIRLDEAGLAVQASLVGRVRLIPYSAIQNFMVTQKGQLALAYQKPDKAPAARSEPPHALTEIRPETHPSGPRYGLIVTPAVGKPGDLAAALAAHVPPSPEPYFSADDLKAWMRRRRLRNLILILLAVLATPVYVVLIGRLVISIQSIGVYTSGR